MKNEDLVRAVHEMVIDAMSNIVDNPKAFARADLQNIRADARALVRLANEKICEMTPAE